MLVQDTSSIYSGGADGSFELGGGTPGQHVPGTAAANAGHHFRSDRAECANAAADV